MDIAQQQDLLHLMRALSDETRLTMTRLIQERARTSAEIAELLQLSEADVSDHLRKMHHAGLVSLRTRSGQRLYCLNATRLQEFRTYVSEIDQPLEERFVAETDSSWIDSLNWDDEDKNILRKYVFDGRLLELPIKMEKEMVIMRWLATKFQPDVRYPEHQVNAILTEVHEDYATLRRGLIEYGLMQRERGGAVYWLPPEKEA